MKREDAYLSSNLALMSALAFLFKAGSLNKSLLTLFLSKLISTEYLQQTEKNQSISEINQSTNANWPKYRVDQVPGWEKVIAVDDSNEWLHLGSLFDSLFAHTLGDFAWVTIDSGDQAVSVWSVSWTLIVILKATIAEAEAKVDYYSIASDKEALFFLAYDEVICISRTLITTALRPA